jgi:hypothetical protein
LKKLSALVVVVAAMLVLAGAALAKSHPHSSPAPTVEPRPYPWFALLAGYPSNATPQVEQRAHKAQRQIRHAKRHIRAARRPLHPRQGTTHSMYESTVHPWVLHAQGCAAAHRHESGVVILDFGKPAFEHHSYGTILFSGRFSPNHRITAALVGWAKGYVHCLPRGASTFVSLARGTSNYHPSVPSVYAAGRRWAGQTIKLQRKLHRLNLDWHVTAAAADDAEPAWDPRFRKTREFIHGFRVAARGHALYDYGSLDGGVGSIWSARQAFYVAGGIRNTAALPEIYNSAQAREWAELAGIARRRFHSRVHFAGVMTQGSPHCHCSLRPHQAHRALVRALASYGVRQTPLPRGGTNIRSS